MIDFVASRQPQGFGAGRSPARVWLKGLNLEVYSNAFLLAGYDTYEASSCWHTVLATLACRTAMQLASHSNGLGEHSWTLIPHTLLTPTLLLPLSELMQAKLTCTAMRANASTARFATRCIL